MRTYSQYCGLAHALDLVGERWALLVVRELVLGPKRFTDLQAGLPGIGTNVLSTRLRELEENGLVTRRTLPPPAASTVYELTPYGRDLEPAVYALGRWGARSLGVRPAGQPLRSGWLGLALRGFSRPEACDLDATVALRLDDTTLAVRLAPGSIAVDDEDPTDPDLVVETSNDVLVALLAGALDPGDAVGARAVLLTGDEGLFDPLVSLFRFQPAHAA